MTAKPNQKSVDIEKALMDPASVFAAPEDVIVHKALSNEQRVEILRRWQYDASEDAVATEEGMQTSSSDILYRILAALRQVKGDVDVESVAPSKHHAMPNPPAGRGS